MFYSYIYIYVCVCTYMHIYQALYIHVIMICVHTTARGASESGTKTVYEPRPQCHPRVVWQLEWNGIPGAGHPCRGRPAGRAPRSPQGAGAGIQRKV